MWKNLQCQLEQQRPDFLFLDLTQEGEGAWLNCCRIAADYPSIRIGVFSTADTAKVVKSLFQIGIHGYALPSIDPQLLPEMVRALSNGQYFLDPALRDKFLDHALGIEPKQPGIHSLTPREQEILNLIVEEHTTKEIAEKLFISACTVETHRLHLIQKLGVKNMAGLVREAVKQQLYAAVS